MELLPFGKGDPVKAILLTLFLIVVISIALFPHVDMSYKLTGFGLSSGLLYLYSGIRKIHEARMCQQHRSWYTQPQILLGIALLLWIPSTLLLSHTAANASGIYDMSILVLTAFMFAFFLAALYFSFRGKTQGRERPGQRDSFTLLRQTVRSGPQPKETREEE